jgi:hypothetical protein
VCLLHSHAVVGTGASKLGLVLLLASGCVTFDPIGPDDDPAPPVLPDGGGSGSTLEARRAFTQEVHPILTVMCSGCHSGSGFGTPWYRPDPDDAYNVLTTFYAPGLLGEPRFSPDAPLITAPQETGQAAYTADQLQRIYYWFGLESR